MPAHYPTQLALLLAATLAGCGSHAQPATRQAPMTTSTKTPPTLEIARPEARAHAVVSLPRQLAAGTALTGRVPPGSQVNANDVAVPVAADGRIDWPVPPDVAELRVRVLRPDGGVIVQRVEIGAR